MKDCRARKVKRRVAFHGHLLFGDDERMSNGIFTALRCRGNAAHAPSKRQAGAAGGVLAWSLVVALPIVAATPPAVVSGVPYQVDSGSVAVQCGKLIDGVAATARGLSTVVIRSGRVESVQAGAASPPGLPIVDLRHYTCLPGLIDMHTHLTDSGHETSDLSVYYQRTSAEQGAIARESARTTLLAGFTGARDVGTYIAWVDRDLRDAINQGNAVGPRMQVAGYYLTIPAGGGDLVIPGHAESEIPPQVRMGVARGPEQFRQKAGQAAAGGADVLKIIASGAVLAFGGVPGEREMSPDEIKAVVDVAHAHGIKVAAHAHGAQSIKDAILAGADTIEHASLIDDEGIRLAQGARHGPGDGRLQR